MSLPPLTAHFTGRGAEIERVCSALQRGPLAVIYGMPGIGKTALAAETARECVSSYTPAWTALADSGDLMERIAAALDAAGESALTAYFAPGGISSSEKATALCELLRRRPFLLVLDDLHRIGAQEASEFLTRVAPHIAPSRILATSRVRLPLPRADELELSGLQEKDSLRLLGSLLGQRAQPHWKPALADMAQALDGHPLSLRLAAAALLEGELSPRALLEGPRLILGQLGEEVLARLYASLGLLEKRLVGVLACFRAGAPEDALHELMGPDASLQVPRLRDRFLAEVTPAGEVAIHPVVREFALTLMPEPEARRLRMEISAYFELRGRRRGNAGLDDLVEAWHLAVASGEDGRAYRLLLGFMDEMLVRGRYRELGPMLDRALATIFEPEARVAIARARMLRNQGRPADARAVLNQVSDRQDPLERSSVLAELGQLEHDAGRFDKALKCYYPALEIAQRLGERALTASLHVRLATVCKDRGEYDRAVKLYQQALDLMRRFESSRDLAFALHNVAKIHYYQGEHEAALKEHLEALELWEKAGDRLSALLARNGIANILRDRGLVERAEETYRQNLEDYRKLANPFGESYTLANLGHIRFLRGENAEALELLGRSVELARQMGNRLGEALALDRLGDVRLSMGEFSQARSLYDQSLAIHRELRNNYGIAIVLNGLGDLERETGNYAAALGRYEEALPLCRHLKDKDGIARALEGRASILADRGDFGAARSSLEEALQLRRQMDEKRGIGRALSSLGHVAGLSGEVDRAFEFYQEGLELFQRMQNRRELQRTLGCLSELHANAEQYEKAAALASQSLELARALSDSKGQAIALTQLGRVALHRGDRDEASRRLEEALELRRKLEDPRGLVATLEPLALAELEAGRYEKAGPMLREAIELANAGGFSRAVLLCRAHLALLALRQDSLDRADRDLSALLQEAIRAGHPEGIAYVQRLLGFLACKRGRPDRAAEQLRQARDLYRRLSIDRESARVERELEAAGKDRLLEQLERRRAVAARSRGLERSLLESEGRTMTAMVVDLENHQLPSGVRDDRRAKFRDVDSPLARTIARHGGEPVRVLGRCLLATFPDAAQALAAALALAGTGRPRVGLDTGRMLAVGNELFGEPVGLAARLHGMAAPGEVLLAHTTWSALPEPKPAAMEAAAQRVRGRESPLRVWKFNRPTGGNG